MNIQKSSSNNLRINGSWIEGRWEMNTHCPSNSITRKAGSHLHLHFISFPLPLISFTAHLFKSISWSSWFDLEFLCIQFICNLMQTNKTSTISSITLFSLSKIRSTNLVWMRRIRWQTCVQGKFYWLYIRVTSLRECNQMACQGERISLK